MKFLEFKYVCCVVVWTFHNVTVSHTVGVYKRDFTRGLWYQKLWAALLLIIDFLSIIPHCRHWKVLLFVMWQKSDYLCVYVHSCMNCQIIIMRPWSSFCFIWRRWWNTVQQTRWRHATLPSSLVPHWCAQQMTTWSPWWLTWQISAKLLSCSSPM